MTDFRLYRRHRFLPGVIAHAVWLCLNLSLSLWTVEDLLPARRYLILSGG